MPEPYPPLQTSIIPVASTILIGLSGGPDSIYLLHQLSIVQQQLNIKIIAAHLDHEWQSSSQIAAQLCKDACNILNIPIIIKKMSELSFEPSWNGSQEEFGRNMRRHFFETLAQEYHATAIALAHHQQDQQETFFIRLLRGSSLAGLTGIKEKDGLYIRPILYCNKKDIISYLHAHHIAYYTDITNTSDMYLRNRIRNHVIPTLQSADTRFDQKIISAMDNLRQVDDFIQQQVTQFLDHAQTDYGVKLQLFLPLHIVLQQSIILQLLIQEQVTFTPSQKLFKEIMRFLEKSNCAQHTIHTSWIIQKSKNCFAIKKIKKSDKTL